MRNPRILYIGNANPNQTSGHRRCALVRMGCNVTSIDPRELLPRFFRNSIVSKLEFHSGYVWSQPWIYTAICRYIAGLGVHSFDIVWVNGGELLGRNLVEFLASKYGKVVLYNNDDPFGGRDGRRFDSLKAAISQYTVCVTVREGNTREYLAAGASRALRVWMSYDEGSHAPKGNAFPEERFTSDVAFIGTWMRNEHRDRVLLTLIEHGINIAIWGDRWKKSPLWNTLKSSYRGGGIFGADYVAAIRGAKVCLGFLSKSNRDLHTRRSVEIPYSGGLLCGERTSEHHMLYKEGEEAVFWSNAEECVAVCRDLLTNDTKRESIRLAGIERIRELRLGNQDICQEILDVALIGKTNTLRPFHST